MEEWKEIQDFPGYYVSNKGRVRSDKCKGRVKINPEDDETILKAIPTGRGYLAVGISNKTTKRKRFAIHKLVAKAFIPNPENKPVVNHIDGNKENNCVENLEWCTQRENIIHSIYVLGNTGTLRHGNPKTVKCIDTGEIFSSAKEAAAKYDIPVKTLYRCLTGKSKSCRNMHWAYI